MEALNDKIAPKLISPTILLTKNTNWKYIENWNQKYTKKTKLFYKSKYNQKCFWGLPTSSPHNIFRKIHQGRNTVFNRHVCQEWARAFVENLVEDNNAKKKKKKKKERKQWLLQFTNWKKIFLVPNIVIKIRKEFIKVNKDIIFIFYLFFVLQIFTIDRTAVEGGGYILNLSLPIHLLHIT